jgi:hypothetical protein
MLWHVISCYIKIGLVSSGKVRLCQVRTDYAMLYQVSSGRMM